VLACKGTRVGMQPHVPLEVPSTTEALLAHVANVLPGAARGVGLSYWLYSDWGCWRRVWSSRLSLRGERCGTEHLVQIVQVKIHIHSSRVGLRAVHLRACHGWVRKRSVKRGHRVLRGRLMAALLSAAVAGRQDMLKQGRETLFGAW
jgi:hypothetical protein